MREQLQGCGMTTKDLIFFLDPKNFHLELYCNDIMAPRYLLIFYDSKIQVLIRSQKSFCRCYVQIQFLRKYLNTIHNFLIHEKCSLFTRLYIFSKFHKKSFLLEYSLIDIKLVHLISIRKFYNFCKKIV